MRSRIFLVAVFCSLLFSCNLFAQALQITHGPYLQAVGDHEVTIVWTTSNDAVSWVEIAPSGTDSFYGQEHPKYFETRNGNRVVGKLHRVTVKGLKAATEYRYRVFSKEVLNYEGHRVLYGNIASTNVYRQKPLRFRTMERQSQEVSFTVINDIHSNVDTLRSLLKDVSFEKTGLVIFNGDMVSAMNDETQVLGGFMDAAVEMFAGEVPAFIVRGNHEARGPFSVKFPDYFPSLSGHPYYSFRSGPVFFIVLDCGEDKPDSDIEYSELAQFDAYRSEQAAWVEKLVQSEEYKSAPYRIVLLHIPPVGSDWHGARDLRRKMVPVLNKAGITAMFSGHTHRYGFYAAGQEENAFPLIINANNTSLDVTVDNNAMTVLHKNTKGGELHRHVFKPAR